MNSNAIEGWLASVERLFATIKATPVISGLAVTVGLGTAWVIHDYRQWKAFGTGGTPPNVYGYCRMTILRIRFAYHVPLQTNPETLRNDGPSFLKAIPQRAGGRPRLMPRILPQRQRPEPIEPATHHKLMALMSRVASQHSDILETRLSRTEGTADGLYARKNNINVNPIVAADRELNYEIGHAHYADNSLHLWLSEADARKVIEARWGQRFCLPTVQRGWTMIYAPRNAEELKLIEEFVKASVRWVTGVAI
uniref:Luciferase domain-containing protein n=1 Tax=Talaromyces marneffei PM1 TaxID=1077442 RepID=A0A093V0W4_TALMA